MRNQYRRRSLLHPPPDQNLSKADWEREARSLMLGARAEAARGARIAAAQPDPALVGAYLGATMGVAMHLYDRSEAARRGVDLR